MSTRTDNHDTTSSETNGSYWAKYKDLTLLFAGAIIGIASSYISSAQQLSAQKQQMLFEQTFRVIREFTELNNSTWQKIDIPLGALDQKLETAYDTLLNKPSNGTLGQHLAKTMSTFSASISDTTKTLSDEARDYEAKLDMTLTLLSYLSNERPEKVSIDAEMSNMTADLEKANQKLDAAIAKNPTQEQSIEIGKIWIEDIRSVIKSQRERNVEDRLRVNKSIQTLAQHALK